MNKAGFLGPAGPLAGASQDTVTLDATLTARALGVIGTGDCHAVITFAGLTGWTASISTDIGNGISTDPTLTALQDAAIATVIAALLWLADPSKAGQTRGALGILYTGNIRRGVRIATPHDESETHEDYR